MRPRTLLFLILGISLLIACNVGKKATHYMQTHPEALAALCPQVLPNDTTVVTDTLIKTDTIFTAPVVDTTVVTCDSAGQQVRSIHTRSDREIRTTYRVHTTSTVLDSAAVLRARTIQLAAERALQKEKDKADRLKSGRDTWRLIAVIALCLLLLGIGYALFRSKLPTR